MTDLFSTQTPRLGLKKPDVGGDVDIWGDELNSNADVLDAALLTSGGTLTGPLTLAGPPTANLHAATKAYVDSLPASATVSDTPPANPKPNQLWFDSASAQLYVWYVDPNSSQWVVANAGGAGAAVVAVTAFAAIADGQKAFTNVSMPVGSHQLSVTNPIFKQSDVGKIINVFRQDVIHPLCPWYSSVPNSTLIGYSVMPRITQFIDPQNVLLNVACMVAPQGIGTVWPAQTWPYAATPSIVCWGTDNSPAFQAALDANGSVFIPDGNYCFGATLVLRSNNTLFGNGPAAVLMPIGILDPIFHNSYLAPFFVSTTWITQLEALKDPAYPRPTPFPELRDQFGDHDITIRDFQVDMSCNGGMSYGLVMRIFLASHILVTRIKCIGSPMAGYEAPAFIACDDVTVTFCEYENTWTGFSPWAGISNVLFAFNKMTIPYNSFPDVSTKQPISGVQINALGLSLDDGQVVSNISVIYNDIHMNGAAGPWIPMAPLSLFPDSAGSAFRDVQFRGNRIMCSGLNNSSGYGAIFVNGSGYNLDISDNLVDGYLGPGPVIQLLVEPVLSTGLPVSVASAPVPPSDVFTVNWPGHGYTGYYLDQFPVFMFIQPSLVVGGVQLQGYWPLKAVLDDHTFTIAGPAEALVTQIVSWPAEGFAQIDQFPIGAKISGNMITNSPPSSPDTSLIVATGVGALITNNRMSNNGTNYQSLISWYGLNNQPTATILGNTGDTGTAGLPAGFLGNGRVIWPSYGRAPVIIDPDDATGRLNITPSMTPSGVWTPVLTFGGVVDPAMTYRSRQGRYTLIGDICYFLCSVALTAKGTAIGAAAISGLPFPADPNVVTGVTDVFTANFAKLTASPQSTTNPIVATASVGGLTFYTLGPPGSGGATGTYPLGYSGGTGSGATGSFFVVGHDAVASASFDTGNPGSGGTDGVYLIPAVPAEGDTTGTGCQVGVSIVAGKIASVGVSTVYCGSGYTATPTVPLDSIPGLIGSPVVTLHLGTGAIVGVSAINPGSYTAAPAVIIPTAGAPGTPPVPPPYSGVTGASITTTVNTTGLPLQLNISGQVHANGITLIIGSSDAASLPLVDANFTGDEFLGVMGWYFVAPDTLPPPVVDPSEWPDMAPVLEVFNVRLSK